MAHYDIYRDRLATTHASFGYALWKPGPEAGFGPVRIGDVGYVGEGKFHRLFNALLPLGDASHKGIPLPEYHEPLILKLPNHVSTDVLNPNNCCSAGVNVLPDKPEHLATDPPDYPQFSFLCTARHGGAVLSLPVDARYQDTRARRDFGKWMLEHIDSWFSFARGLGLGIDHMEEIILVTGCHHTRTWANVVFLENQSRAQASFGIKATQARGREANDQSINLKWEFPLGSAQGAVCSQGPEGNLKDLQEDQCIFLRGFRVVRRLGIFPKQLRGAAGPNPSLDEDQDNQFDKELGSIPAIAKTRDPLHALLDHIVGRSPNCDMVLVHDDDLARISRLRDSSETLQPQALMDYLQQAQPEIYRCDHLPTREDGPRNDTGPITVAMFLEEFHEWGKKQTMPTHLLDLPPELVEHILALLAHQDASSLPACRQTCRALNTTIAQSQLVRYIERTALLGVYDPLIPIADAFEGTGEATDGTSTAITTTSMMIPERAAALEAWNEAWSALDDVLFTRKTDLRIAMPSRDELEKGPMAEVVGVTGSRKFATPTTSAAAAAVREAEAEAESLDHQRQWWDEGPENEWHAHFSFGPRFVAATREGPGVRAGYSYMDVHGSLGRGECATAIKGMGASTTGASCEDKGEGECEGLRWTTINVPVRNIVVFALSTELDLAVAISARVERKDGAVTSHLEVRPLRFLDGTPHPCAEVPTIRVTATGASAHNMAQTQVLGDYLLLWIGGPHEEDYSLCKLYLIAWKRGSVTLLRENPAGKYGSIGTMISEDVFALVQLNPPGIELSRISNMKVDGIEPRMNKLCTLLLPALQDGARLDWAVCDGEHPGHQSFSRGPWPAYRYAPRRRQFRQSTRDSIVSVVMQITGKWREVHIFDLVVRSATLLAHAAATADVESSSSNGGDGGGQEERPAGADAQDKNGDEDEDEDDVNVVPWASWGPRETSMSDHSSFEWNDLLGERRATVDLSGRRIRLYDYNPYRIRQARASGLARVHQHHHVGGGREMVRPQQRQAGDSDKEDDEDEELELEEQEQEELEEQEQEELEEQEQEELEEQEKRQEKEKQQEQEHEQEGNTGRSHRNSSRRITETSTIKGGQWFQNDVSTALPHLDTVIYELGCRGIYMEQDLLLLHVDDIYDHVIWPNGPRRRPREGFVLYRM